jgi:hypothetical protein
MVSAWPALSTMAQKVGVGQATDAVATVPAPPDGTGVDPTPGRRAVGVDQSVPLPVLTWPDPSTITHVGPRVQVRVGRIGTVTGPVAGAG